jgi:hypothetical protein
VLTALYGCLWAFVGLVGYLAISSPPPVRAGNPGVYAYPFFALIGGAVTAPGLLVLAVFLWRGSMVAVVLTLVPTLWLALPLLAILGVEAVNLTLRPDLIDWRGALGAVAVTLAVLLAGPGLVLALLFAPSSRRVWAPRSAPAGEASS